MLVISDRQHCITTEANELRQDIEDYAFAVIQEKPKSFPARTTRLTSQEFERLPL